MIVDISTMLTCSIDEAVSHLKTPRLLEFVASPLVRFVPVRPPVFPEVWSTGEYSVALRLFGVVPFGTQAIVIARPRHDRRRGHEANPFFSVAICCYPFKLEPSVSVRFRLFPLFPIRPSRARVPGTGIPNGNKRFRHNTDTNGEKQITTDPPRSATNAVACAPFNSKTQSRGPARIVAAATEQIRSYRFLSVAIRSSRNRLFPLVSVCFRCFRHQRGAKGDTRPLRISPFEIQESRQLTVG